MATLAAALQDRRYMIRECHRLRIYSEISRIVKVRLVIRHTRIMRLRGERR
jgi:hypothetical protein